MLSQIGQDTATAEQQMKIVNAQIEKIKHLKTVHIELLFGALVWLTINSKTVIITSRLNAGAWLR